MAEKNFKVLITDDVSELRELLTEAVSNWGYSVSVATNGEEALKTLKSDRHDIAVCDLMMPGMDGLTLLNNIKKFDKDIIVILITGYATMETAMKAIESGAYDYIAKPFRLDELMIVLKNACDRLRLMSENKALTEELSKARGELASLRKAVLKK